MSTTKKKTTKKEVAVTEETTTALAMPEVDFGADAMAGLENVTAADQVIPRLAILQKLSKACDRDEPEYISGAEPGDFLDNITNTLFNGEDGIYLVPL